MILNEVFSIFMSSLRVYACNKASLIVSVQALNYVGCFGKSL